MTQIEEQLNSKFEEIPKEIRTNKNHNVTTDEKDVESRQPGIVVINSLNSCSRVTDGTNG